MDAERSKKKGGGAGSTFRWLKSSKRPSFDKLGFFSQ